MRYLLRVFLDGEYIGYFESCQDASRKTGVNDRLITECCLFKRKSAEVLFGDEI